MDPWHRRLMVVDDEPMVASLLVSALEAAGFEARSCGSAPEARTLVDDFDPDGALIDIHLGDGPSGLHLGHILRVSHPHVGLVFLTRFNDPRLPGDGGSAMPEGSAFLAKDSVTDTGLLLDAIESVLGESIDPVLAGPRPGRLAVLTLTQLEILRLAASGLTNAAIARRRGTTERSVEQRLQSVYQTLGIEMSIDVNPRVEAVRVYIVEAGMPSERDGAGSP